MGNASVRVSRATHEQIRGMSEQTGLAMQRVVEKAIRELETRLFWEATNDAYASLREDKKAWAKELSDREAWATTLADGLETADHA